MLATLSKSGLDLCFLRRQCWWIKVHLSTQHMHTPWYQGTRENTALTQVGHFVNCPLHLSWSSVFVLSCQIIKSVVLTQLFLIIVLNFDFYLFIDFQVSWRQDTEFLPRRYRRQNQRGYCCAVFHSFRIKSQVLGHVNNIRVWFIMFLTKVQMLPLTKLRV